MKDKISTDFIELLDEFIEFLERFDWSADYAYEILEARMDFLKLEIQKTEDNYPPDILKEMKNFFREKTDKYF